jgi:hypothetical protein
MLKIIINQPFNILYISYLNILVILILQPNVHLFRTWKNPDFEAIPTAQYFDHIKFFYLGSKGYHTSIPNQLSSLRTLHDRLQLVL